MKKRAFGFLLVAGAALVAVLASPANAYAASTGRVSMLRLYNKYSGEHLYTSDTTERDNLVSHGWAYEGEGWVAPQSSDTPVYRLYNRWSGDHHYTTSKSEYEDCVNRGWSDEGIAWFSDDAKTAPVYREFNPYAAVGSHNYTGSKDEHEYVTAIGWNDEGVAWYALEVKNLKANVTNAVAASSHSIMGNSAATGQQMAAYYKSMGHAYPSSVYSKYGASNIEQFAQIVCEEAAAEGVRAEVVFCQSMHETGWLQYGGQVSAWQCNFAGIGATNGGAAGASFSSVREGVRAQVQHLKAYASTASLNNACVDPRFNLVSRGIAPNLEDLDGRWAVPGNGYGEGIYNMIQVLLTF